MSDQDSSRVNLRNAFNVVALSAALLAGPSQARAQTSPQPKGPPVTPPAVTQMVQKAPPVKQPKPVLVSAFTPMIASAEEKDRNIFFKETAQAIREFRALQNHGNLTGPLNKEERQQIRTTLTDARADAKKYKISLEVAASLRFAAQQTGNNPEAFIERLSATSGNLANADPAGLSKNDVFKFNIPTWLKLVKDYGAQHGLGYFANQIKVETVNGRTTVEVPDGAMLREISAMRDNPRINTLMGGEYVRHEAELKPVDYKGAGYMPDGKVMLEQHALHTLGFDLGPKGPDGITGPLLIASRDEFKDMSKPLFAQGKLYEQMLVESAEQAETDSKKWTNKWNNVTPAAAFAVRHAAKVVGVDFGYMMELASAESGFQGNAKASTSSATGIYQFTDDTWMTMLYLNGAKYGLKDIADHIDVKRDGNNNIIAAKINDPIISKYALDLRTDPRVNALMGAEFAKENKAILEAAMPKTKVDRTEQYLAHFLGPGQAVDFLTQMKKHPDKAADGSFPNAANANQKVFYNDDGSARSLTQVYDFFKKKFHLGVFDPPPPPPPPKQPAAKKPAHK